MSSSKQKKDDFYLGNRNLPNPETEFQWTSEMVEDLERCRNSILHFSKFFYIINLDEGKQPIKLYPVQKRVLKSLVDHRFNVVLASRQIGKALALDTPIPTPTGWTTMGALKPGDKVYGLNGKSCNVVHAHDIMYNRECYKVTFDNGEVIIADSEHQWFTESRAERKIGGTVKTTKEIYNTLHVPYCKEPNHRIPVAMQGINGISKILPIEPYVLGLWLGDGTSSSNIITIGILKENNLLNNKHIPKEYMFANRNQRLSLLQGLIDSDGYVSKAGICQFYNTNISLVKQVKELVESLGYKVTYKEYIPTLNGVDCSLCASITFMPIEYVCRLSFKRNRIKIKLFSNQSRFRAQWHYIKNVKPTETVPVRCITVDSKDSLYLCGKQYIPTHNTSLLTIFALWMICFKDDYRVLLIANKEGTAINIFKRIRLAYEMLPNHLKPGVIEYSKTGILLANGSSIGISTTTSDAARGESINCVTGDSLVTVRDKETGEVKKISMEDLYNELKHTNFKMQTKIVLE